MMNFIANSMRRFGLAPDNKVDLQNGIGDRAQSIAANPLSHMTIGSKWSYSTLQYPLDIQGRSDLGHYMMFYINVPNDSSMAKSGNLAGSAAGLDRKDSGLNKIELNQQKAGILQELGYAKENTMNWKHNLAGNAADSGPSESDQWKPGQSEVVIERKHHQSTTAKMAGKKLTKRTQDAVILPMPATIMANYLASYKESELGGLMGEGAGAVKKSFDKISKGESVQQVATEAIPDAANIMKEVIAKAGFAIAKGLGLGDWETARNKLSNQAENNFLEVMFTGLGFRKFSWTWKFAPRSPQEVLEVQKIIKLFKFHMLPELPDERFGRFYIVPSEFDIFYMFRGEENEFINRISSCVCVNMDINYAPSGYQTFRPIENEKGAPMTEIDMKLDFMETKLITRADVNKGY